MKKLEIGQTIYTFDGNRRIYTEENNPRPIYSEHFRPFTIKSETEKEYVLDHGTINKRSGMLTLGRWKRRIYTEKEKDDDIFLEENRYKVREKVGQLRDVKKLKKIIEILNEK